METGSSLSPVQVCNVVKACIRARLPLLLVGPPGVGKSDVVKQAVQDLGCDIIVSHPVVSDPTDARGLPWPSATGEEARFLPFGELARALKAERPTVWFLDDLGQAPPAVQASFMQLVLAKRVNGHVLPDQVTFVAATNRRQDRAGVAGVIEPLKSRFVIAEVRPDIESFSRWANANGIRPEVLGFLQWRPDLLHQFAPSTDITNSPCPRTWAHVSRVLDLALSPDEEAALIAGSVGLGAAVEFQGFLRLARNLPDVEQVIKNPDVAPIPDDPAVLFALVAALAARASAETVKGVIGYAERLRRDGKGEFGVLLVRDAYRRAPGIARTAAFRAVVEGPLGALIRGEV